MEIRRIGVDESVEVDFPPQLLSNHIENATDLDVQVLQSESELPSLDAIITYQHRPELLQIKPNWVHLISAGFDHFPHHLYSEIEVRVTNSSGIHGRPIGETVIPVIY